MSRGRLVFAFLSDLYRVDPRATAASPGLDEDFREPALLDENDDGLPDKAQREHPPVRVPCQVEPSSRSDELRMTGAGNAAQTRVELVFHFEDLERLGLVDTDGEPLLRVGDRLGALLTTRGELVWRIPAERGLFATDVRPLGFGLPHRAPRRNLLLVAFESRSAGAPRGGV